MYNYDMLIGRIRSYGNDATFSKVAKQAGMSLSTLNRRLKGEPFNATEIMKISKTLGITSDERNDYFFTVNVQHS